MILSKKLNLVFVKGKKVGGTSIEFALSQICGPDDVVTPLTPADDRVRIDGGYPPRNFTRGEGLERAYVEAVKTSAPSDLGRIKVRGILYKNHMTHRQIRAVYGHDLSHFTVMCAERSPYDKITSLAKWSLSKRTYVKGETAPIDLEGLRAEIARKFEAGTIAAARNIDRYLNRRGELPKIILHFENLDAEFAAALQAIGVADPPALPRMKQTAQLAATTQEIFNRKQLDWINAAFAEEFDAFGYQRL